MNAKELGEHAALMAAVAKADAEYRASDYWNASVPLEQQVAQGIERMRLDYAAREARTRLAAFEYAQLQKVGKS